MNSTNEITTTTNAVTPETNTTAVLPDGYCNGGFMNQNNTILKRAYVDTYAQQLAHII